MKDVTEEVVRKIADEVSNDEEKMSGIVPERVEDVKSVFSAMKSIASGEDIEVTCNLHTPYGSMGTVSVIGKRILIKNPKIFADFFNLASNFEIYPKVDGTVQMNFTFHNLTRKGES